MKAEIRNSELIVGSWGEFQMIDGSIVQCRLLRVMPDAVVKVACVWRAKRREAFIGEKDFVPYG